MGNKRSTFGTKFLQEGGELISDDLWGQRGWEDEEEFSLCVFFVDFREVFLLSAAPIGSELARLAEPIGQPRFTCSERRAVDFPLSDLL